VRIELTSVHVNDQDKALTFYTEVLGFVVKENFPVGEFKWLTVVSPEAPDAGQLLLEPNDNRAARAYQNELYEQGIPHAVFAVDDIQAEYERLVGRGVVFSIKPIEAAGGSQAVFDDTCGNHVMIYEVP
jgi:catechol 2,3-dioxygenase-like lactoylglutathione lyase family enzyme